MPDGKKTNIPRNADDETRRSLERENDVADVLAQSGYKVKQNPGTKANGTKPDYLVEGRIFDCYAPETKNPRNIWEYIKKEKVDKGQADRVILNLSDSKVDLQALKKQFTEWEMEGLKEVIIVRDGKSVGPQGRVPHSPELPKPPALRSVHAAGLRQPWVHRRAERIERISRGHKAACSGCTSVRDVVVRWAGKVLCCRAA